jgi:hypothetical protein
MESENRCPLCGGKTEHYTGRDPDLPEVAFRMIRCADGDNCPMPPKPPHVWVLFESADRVAELEAENGKLRAGLEKVRDLQKWLSIRCGVAPLVAISAMTIEARLTDALAGVDHGEMTAEEEVIADSDYAASISPYGFGE